MRSGDLQVIFTVDVFNEGLDVPQIDTVLMLRPTESPVVFLQQLGRGLRKATGKNPDALVMGRHGEDCPRKRGEIGMQSLRLGDEVGKHTVYFGALGMDTGATTIFPGLVCRYRASSGIGVL